MLSGSARTGRTAEPKRRTPEDSKGLGLVRQAAVRQPSVVTVRPANKFHASIEGAWNRVNKTSSVPHTRGDEPEANYELLRTGVQFPAHAGMNDPFALLQDSRLRECVCPGYRATARAWMAWLMPSGFGCVHRVNDLESPLPGFSRVTCMSGAIDFGHPDWRRPIAKLRLRSTSPPHALRLAGNSRDSPGIPVRELGLSTLWVGRAWTWR